MGNLRRALPLRALLLALAGAATVAAHAEEEAITLPQPTGSLHVGTAVWHWIDSQRRDNSGGRDLPAREIMAQLWYPADTDAPATPYRPLSGGRYASVRQHAVAGAPFAAGIDSASVIALCPGRGTSKNFYTAIAEDLASHGYAVFSIDSPAIGYVEYPDGRSVDPSDAYRASFELITGPYEKVDAFYEPAVAIGLADWRFALRQLARINKRDPARRLTGRLALKTMAAFGHSLGGRICGALAAGDRRVVALAAMEGVPPRAARQGGLRAASLMLYSSQLPEDMALPNIREVYDNRIAEATIIRLEGFGHNSVTDRVLLAPAGFNYEVDPARGLHVTRLVLRAFLDAHLANRPFSPDALAAMPEVTVIETSAR